MAELHIKQGLTLDDNGKNRKAISQRQINTMETGKEEYFDAFVSYHTDDQKFIQELSDRLETEEGFKLCIPNRDFQLEHEGYILTAELIKNRCKRTIIVLSKSYVEMVKTDEVLNWQLQFTLTHAIDSRQMNILVPMVIDSGVKVPDVLRPFNACQYKSQAPKQWFWQRVQLSLGAPTDSHSSYLGPAHRLGTRLDTEKELCQAVRSYPTKPLSRTIKSKQKCKRPGS